VIATSGSTGTPTFLATSLALSFRPIVSIASGGGPTNTRPAATHARAKPAFSDRNPYPGWIASAPISAAARRIFSWSR
jgi:hypothetical protein